MAESPTPRQMLKDLLQGIAPPRPLFLPIVFSLGARIENLPLPSFLANSTKITNALRQIRGRLPADGVTCYFDPFLEVEALGAALRCQSDDQLPSICWPEAARKGELPRGLRSPEEAVKAGRIGVAVEVIRRLNSLLREDTLLMGGASGPFTLAAQLVQFSDREFSGADDLSGSAFDLSAAMLTQVASAFVEAGAHVIFIHEDVMPRLSAESCEDWANRLSPALNIIRFYGALPVLLLTNPAAAEQNLELLVNRELEGVLCPAVDALVRARASGMETTRLGVALPTPLLAPDAGLVERIRSLRPAIVTTSGDVPASTDIKQLTALFEEVGH